MGQVLAKIVEWQLEHPDGGKEECKSWLKEELKEGRITFDAESRIKRGTNLADESGRGGKKTKR
jgi:tRNA nucleotidyltransferase (CCA-adding enzyme)